MKSAIGVGKGVDKAIADALAQLGCSQDEVTVRVISEGGLFKKAEVELTRDNYVEPVKEKKPEPVKTVSAPVAEKKPEPELKKEPVQKLKIHTDEQTSRQTASEKKENISSSKKTEPVKPIATIMPKIITPPKAVPAATKSANDGADNKAVLTNFLTELIKFSAVKNAEINVIEEDAHYKALISGEALSSLIGSSGETMQAIEIILNILSAKNKKQNKRVMLDIGSYKQNKVSRLHEQAETAAKRVRETGEQVKLRPMTNRERRVVHAHLQTQKDIKTFSKGEEPHRYVVVAKADIASNSKEIQE